jgi:trehalose-phosphatase
MGDILPGRACTHRAVTEVTASAGSPPADTLRAIASADSVLIALDFDGTLAHLVDNPDDARMTPECAHVLTTLTNQPGVHIALVSGRSIHDLKRVAEPHPRWWLVGSHGVEILGPDGSGIDITPEPDAADREALWQAFGDVAAQFSGVWVERKSQGAAMHTRGVSSEVEKSVHALLLPVIDQFGVPLTTRRGHGIVESALRASNKGDGIAALRGYLSPEVVVFMGDDVTDEDGFAALGPGDVAVKVGTDPTIAPYRILDPDNVSRFLESLVAALSAP